MKLYELKDEYHNLLALVEDGQLTQEQIADTLDSVNHDFEEKVRNCLMMVKHLEGQQATAKAEFERLKALSDSYGNQAEKLKEYVRGNMESLDKDKLDLGIFKVTLKKPSQTLGLVDESKIPETYYKIIPETKQLDKRLLLADLKQSPIEGVELRDGKRALLIK